MKPIHRSSILQELEILDENKSKLTTIENHNLNLIDITRCKDLENIKVLEVIDEKHMIDDYVFNEEQTKFQDGDNIIIINGRLVDDFDI